MAERYIIINDETGEIKDIPEGITIRTPKQNEGFQKQLQKKHVRNDYGPFTWLLYTPKEDLGLDIPDSSLTKLIYLSTFLGYDSFLQSDYGSPLDRSDCQEILKMTRTPFNTFWEDLVSKNIIEYNNDKVYINKDIFKKGELSIGERAIRLNINSIRYLYENCRSIRDHAQLSYIFKIIPWVNYEWNIVCTNPEEEKRNDIHYMRLGEFCEKIGYDKSKARRLSDALSSVKFKPRNKDKLRSAFVYVIDKDWHPNEWCIIMNPLIYYGGKNYNHVECFEF